jgi:hypothetical protein
MLCHSESYGGGVGAWGDACMSYFGRNGHSNREKAGGKGRGRWQRKRWGLAVHLWMSACEREGRGQTHSSLVGRTGKASVSR